MHGTLNKGVYTFYPLKSALRGKKVTIHQPFFKITIGNDSFYKLLIFNGSSMISFFPRWHSTLDNPLVASTLYNRGQGYRKVPTRWEVVFVKGYAIFATQNILVMNFIIYSCARL